MQGYTRNPTAADVRRLVKGVLGVDLSETAGTLRRYIVTHEDKARRLYFHPVLLEKLAKSDEYSLHSYVRDVQAICGKPAEYDAWAAVCHKNLCAAR